MAETLFDAADRRVAGMPKPAGRSLPERMRLTRLAEKLRAGTLDSEERAELADLLQEGVR